MKLTFDTKVFTKNVKRIFQVKLFKDNSKRIEAFSKLTLFLFLAIFFMSHLAYLLEIGSESIAFKWFFSTLDLGILMFLVRKINQIYEKKFR